MFSMALQFYRLRYRLSTAVFGNSFQGIKTGQSGSRRATPGTVAYRLVALDFVAVDIPRRRSEFPTSQVTGTENLPDSPSCHRERLGGLLDGQVRKIGIGLAHTAILSVAAVESNRENCRAHAPEHRSPGTREWPAVEHGGARATRRALGAGMRERASGKSFHLRSPFPMA
jgi:hypothetical protein